MDNVRRRMNFMWLSLSGLSTTHVLAYLDDIVIFSRTMENHYRQLHEVLECLRHNNITINLAKFSFAMNQVDLLGCTLSATPKTPYGSNSKFPTTIDKDGTETFLGTLEF